MRSPVPIRLLVPAILIVSVSTQPIFLLGAGFVRIGPDLGFSITGLGGYTALYFFTASVASPLMGRVVQRIGWRKSMTINAAGMSTMLLAIAILARSPLTLALLLVPAALVYSLANPSANLSIAAYGSPLRRALLFGLKQSGIPTSTLLAGLAVPVIVLSFGWRWAYVAGAGLGVIVLLVMPRTEAPFSRPSISHDPRRVVAPMRTAHLAALAAGAAFAVLGAVFMSTYLVTAAVERGFSEKAAGLLLFGGSAVALTARIVLGALADRRGSKGFAHLGVMPVIGAAAFAAMPLTNRPIFALLVLAAFGTAWGWPGLMTYAVVNANHASAASSTAIPQAGIFVGSGSGPLLLAWIVHTWSFDAAFVTVAASLIVAAILFRSIGRAVTAVSLAEPGSPV